MVYNRVNFETAGGERASATASDSPGIKLDIYIYTTVACIVRKGADTHIRYTDTRLDNTRRCAAGPGAQ